ncbi:MAG: T9SS type A sorting domain-containing protein [Balneolaceae bacterium]
MSNNYPNPFNPTTQIEYTLTVDSEVSIKVYNVMGQEVATMVNNTMSAGTHQATFDAGNLSSGMYFAKINAVSSSGETFSKELKCSW